uniref:T-box domain-containing protein n=1 Tax=Monodelphis domestica TaxID=13616 RepID=A0A5F8G4Q3_MONDO
MKLDKKGRNMFPFLVYKIQGMDPSALYHVFVEVEPVDKHPWKYQRGKWLPLKDKKEEDNLPGNRFYQHPDSPNTGAHWMDREIAFKNLKLANKETACKNGSQAPILLKSLHKYQPRLHIEEVSDASFSRHNFTFPDTEFITVTAYQNPGIRRLKIQNNPFASGFRRKPSCPGESLQKSPPAGECSGSTSSPTALLVSNYPLQVQQGPGQEKDCDFMCGSQSPSGQLYETSDSRSTTSLVLPLTGEGLNPDLLPCTSQNDVSYHPSTDTPITQGNWSFSLSNCTSNENGMECFNSPNAMPQKAGTQSEEEERLQDQLFSSSYSNLSDVSNLGQRPSKKRCLSPVDSDKYSSTSAWKTREQEKGLGASESSGNNFHEAVAEGSCYPVVLQEDTDQTKEMMNPTSGNSIQETQSPSELPSDSIDLVLHAALCELFPDNYPPAMANDPRPDANITQGNWSCFLSNSTSNGNSTDCLPSESPKPQQASTGTEEEERLQEQFCLSSIRSLSDVSPLEQRPSKKRCLTPVNSAKDSSTSAWKTRGQEKKLLPSESNGSSIHEAVAEGSCYPVVLQEDTDQTKGMMNPTPGNSIQETQPLSELPSDSTALDLHTVLCEILPAIYSPAMPPDPSPDTHITEGNWPHSLSNCTSIGNGMECFQSVNAKPQQASTGTEEEERLQEQFCLSRIRSLSDDSPLEQRPSKERCLTPVNSAKDSSAPAWKAIEQEDKYLGASESSGNNFHEAVAEGSCYPVVLQEDTDQTKGMMNPTPGNSIQETQPLSELPSDSTALDLHAVLCEIFPAIYSPVMPPDPSPDTHITEGNWPRSLSNCTSIGNGMECFQSVNAKPQQASTGTEEEERLQEQFCLSTIRSLSDVSPLEQRPSKERCLTPVNSAKDSSAPAWKAIEQEDKYLGASESSGNNFHEAVAEGSCYPVVLQEDTDQTKGMMNPTPGNSVQETQSPLELPSDSTALDLHTVLCEILPAIYSPAMPPDPSPDTHITEGNCPRSLSNCTSIGNGMECFQSVNAKPQQSSTGTEEEERLQEQFCLSSIRSLSDDSPLEQRPSKERCLTPVNSAKDSSTSAWKIRGQEKKLLPSESNGSSIHEAVAEGSCYPVVLQEDTDQTKGMKNPTPGNS